MVIGLLLYYKRALDYTILSTLNQVGTQQDMSTENSRIALKQL